MTPADVLEAAADALFVHGRAVGRGQAADGRMCPLGAIQHVQGRDAKNCTMGVDYRDPARVALERFLVDSCGFDETVGSTGRMAAWCWNDGLSVTPENDAYVIGTLKSCAKALREVES